MPQVAAEQRDRAAEQRHATVEHHQVSFAGTIRFHGEADLLDALDFDHALTLGAAHQAHLGSTEPLDVRRSKALGMLARGELALPLTRASGCPTAGNSELGDGAADADVSTSSTTRECASTGSTSGVGQRPGKRGREVVLFVHLSDDALRSGDPDAVADSTHDYGLITAGQVADWCRLPDTAKVTVKPVIDLNAQLTSPGYQPSDRLDEQVRVRDRHCIFPYCHRPATNADVDHIDPYHPDKPVTAGDLPQTRTDNLAVLCRLHHRVKTHGGWTYDVDQPGTFRWRSPYGYTYRRDHTGTTDLTPTPIAPPGQPPGEPPRPKPEQ
jgi:hypothetical protein